MRKSIFMVLSMMILTAITGFADKAFAGGLSTSFGDIFIENLQLGEEYSTKDLINLPLMVKNDSAFTMDMKVEVMIPAKQDLREGFEALPDPSWIRLAKSTFTVQPGGFAETDVFIKIPKDIKLKGKQYQLYLHSYTIPRKDSNISVGLASRLSFTVAEKDGSRKGKNDMGVFVMKPDNLFIIDVEPGKKVDVWKEKSKVLEIFNPNKLECTYRLESISVREAGITLRKGFEEMPVPGFITFAEKTKKVLPRSSEKVYLFINIPNKPEYREKNYMVVIKAVQITGKVAVQVYSNVYVMTK